MTGLQPFIIVHFRAHRALLRPFPRRTSTNPRSTCIRKVCNAQEKHCRIYSRDSSPAVVAATQEAFRSWLRQRFGDRVQLCTPARRWGPCAASYASSSVYNIGSCEPCQCHESLQGVCMEAQCVYSSPVNDWVLQCRHAHEKLLCYPKVGTLQEGLGTAKSWTTVHIHFPCSAVSQENVYKYR